MELTPYERACFKIIVTCVAVSSVYGIASYLLSIPVGQVIVMTVTTLCVGSGLRRPVSYLERKFGVPRTLSLIGIYLALIVLLVLASIELLPMISQQVTQITSAVSAIWDSHAKLQQLLPGWIVERIPSGVTDRLDSLAKENTTWAAGYLGSFAQKVPNWVGSILSMGSNTVMVLIFAFFIARRQGLISGYATALMTESATKSKVIEAIDSTMLELGQWANAQALTGAFFGSTFGTSMSLFGMDYGFTIGLIGFMAESIVPMAGSAVVLVILGLPMAAEHSGLLGMAELTAAYGVIFVLQWQVMYQRFLGRSLNYDAFITFLAMWLGYFPLGFVGSVLVLPCLVICSNLLKFSYPHLMVEADPQTPTHQQLIRIVRLRIARLFSGQKKPPQGES